MSVMRATASLSVFACLLTIGCSNQRGSSEGMDRVRVQSRQVGAEATEAQTGSASPEWFDKHERLRRALEGLSFDTGVVEVDAELADDLIAGLDGVAAEDRVMLAARGEREGGGEEREGRGEVHVSLPYCEPCTKGHHRETTALSRIRR